MKCNKCGFETDVDFAHVCEKDLVFVKENKPKLTVYELEQQILDCWHVVDDLDILLEGVLEKELTKDEISNIILGLKSLYQLKFDKAFDTFEKCVREKSV